MHPTRMQILELKLSGRLCLFHACADELQQIVSISGHAVADKSVANHVVRGVRSRVVKVVRLNRSVLGPTLGHVVCTAVGCSDREPDSCGFTFVLLSTGTAPSFQCTVYTAATPRNTIACTIRSHLHFFVRSTERM
jgi:hypothetical protein